MSEWERCRKFIEPSIPFTYGTHTIEDIEREIAAGRLQFTPGENSAVVTEILNYPRLRAVNFFLVGGDMKEIVEVMEPEVVARAKILGCTRVAQHGRPGWGRVLAPYGYKTVLSTMLKDI